MLFFSKPKKESPYKFACPFCGENLSKLNPTGDYSCDFCHKLYTYSELMKAYGKLARHNRSLETTVEFHRLAAESANKELRAARMKIYQLENQINTMRLDAFEYDPREYYDTVQDLRKRVKALETMLEDDLP